MSVNFFIFFITELLNCDCLYDAHMDLVKVYVRCFKDGYYTIIFSRKTIENNNFMKLVDIIRDDIINELERRTIGILKEVEDEKIKPD